MKKKTILLLAGMIAAVSLTGCGGSSSTNNTETETSDNAEGITGYLVDNAKQYVTIGNIDKLEVEKPIYTVSDEEVLSQIESHRYEMAQTKAVDRGAQIEDQLTLSLKASIQGEEEPYIDEEDYITQLGYEEFGAEFDEQITGCKAGESKSFSCSFDENTWYEEWIDKTVDFEVTVKKVEEVVVPEYNEDYVTKTLGYESMETYEADVRQQLQDDYAEQALDETRENAIVAAMDASDFNGHPDKLYDSCKEAIEGEYKSFAENFGMTIEDLYEAYGMTADEVTDEVNNEVNRRIFVSAICQQENIILTDSEYQAFLNDQYTLYGFSSPEEFETLYTKDYLLWFMYTQKVGDYLLEHVSLYDAPVVFDGGFEDEEGMEEIDGMAFDDVEEITVDGDEELVEEDVDEISGLEEEASETEA